MKFVTGRTIEDSIELYNTADDFLKTVQPLIEQFVSENVFNSDQSDFQLEIYSRRSLSNQDIKKVESVLQCCIINNTLIYPTINNIM